MICSKCKKDKQPEEFGLRGGVRFKQCKKCCTARTTSKRKMNALKNPKQTTIAGWPWKWNGLVYGENRV